MPKEIVTLSFGSYASFCSAHYWNLQDEAAGYSSLEDWSGYAACIDHNVLFLETEGRNGFHVHRPRAVLFDIAGSSGGLSFSEDAVAVPPSAASVSSWRGACEVHRADPIPRSAFLERLSEHEDLDWETMGDDEAAKQQAALEAAARQLDPGGGDASRGVTSPASASSGGVTRYWTDFCKVVFHPRTVYSLPGSWTSPYEHSLAAGWGAAMDLLDGGGGRGGGGSGLVEDAVDRVRYMGEACDSLAGFQVLIDDLTGFGALAAAVLEEVVEEYSGRPLVLFSVRQPGQWERQQDGGSAGGSMSTASKPARVRDDLSQALALTRAAELAALYVPLAAPAVSGSLPYLSYNALLPYHSSAILACGVDTALLPTRLTDARSPLGEPLGATDLHSMVRLLRPGGSVSLVGLHLALPCTALPAGVQQVRQQLDERVRPPHASGAVGTTVTAAGPPGEVLRGYTAQLSLVADLASLTPGIIGRDDGRGGLGSRGASRAESYCLRGGRKDTGPVATASALEALDLLLLRQPHRMCVRHRCTAPMPLAVPLPFPKLFRSSVSQHGDVIPPKPELRSSTVAGSSGMGGTSSPSSLAAARAAGESVHSVPVLTRLQVTGEFEGWVRWVGDRWARATVGAAGRAVLESWGFGRDDAAEIGSQLDDIGAAFADEDEV
ncbi:hypothetical protein VaNZ11_002679 [Volvox africanus]|uniref:Misato Segment II tubulin-like domain-containing protein n=1 Tax=Volvox africanus TaxID=51714 RepID=A0ABQ5RU36_9CHLO|nr:hypothetical protein VaNZ11_002679 [Volvox africanus]